MCRTVAMSATDGLKRGMSVLNTGDMIKVPVGKEVLGRILNVIGDPVDGGEAVQASTQWPIHRDSPSLEDQSIQTEMLVTGIQSC